MAARKCKKKTKLEKQSFSDEQASADDAEAFSVSDTTPVIINWQEDETNSEGTGMDKTATTDSTYRAAPSNEIKIWKAKKGQDLVDIIEEWSAEENISTSWNANTDQELDYDVFISGTFENAVDVLLSKGLRNAPNYTLSKSPYHLHMGDSDS